MRPPLRVLGTVAAVTLLPAPAHAHLVTTGLGPLYDGISHLFLSFEDLLPVVALALLAGLNGPKVFGNLVTDGNGNADYDVFVPNKADNRTFRFEALQLGSCIITELVTYSFP